MLVGLAALPFAAQVNDHLDASVRLIGSESAQVEAALRDRFKSPFTTVALLRVTGAPAAPTTDGRMLLGRLVAALRDTPGVQGVMSYLDRKETLFIGTDASPILIVGLNAAGAGLSAAGSGDAIMAKLRAATAAVGAEWAGSSSEKPPVALDASLIFAPVGPLVVAALTATAGIEGPARTRLHPLAAPTDLPPFTTFG